MLKLLLPVSSPVQPTTDPCFAMRTALSLSPLLLKFGTLKPKTHKESRCVKMAQDQYSTIVLSNLLTKNRH